MSNWKTTVFGFLAGFFQVLGQQYPQYQALTGPVSALFMGLMGFQAKDK